MLGELTRNSVLVSAHTYLWIRGRPKTTKHMADRIRIVWETSSRRAVARNNKKQSLFSPSVNFLTVFH